MVAMLDGSEVSMKLMAIQIFNVSMAEVGSIVEPD